jgi:hypothetical protein
LDAESDEPRAKRVKVQRQLDFLFNKPLVMERRYLLSIVTNISYFIVRTFDVKHHDDCQSSHANPFIKRGGGGALAGSITSGSITYSKCVTFFQTIEIFVSK